MPRLLVVHHTPSPALQAMFEAAVSGSRNGLAVSRPGGVAGGASAVHGTGAQ